MAKVAVTPEFERRNEPVFVLVTVKFPLTVMSPPARLTPPV